MKQFRTPSIAVRLALGAALLLPFTGLRSASAQATASQDHVVGSQALQQQLDNSAAARQKNIQTLNEFVATSTAEKVMHDSHVDAQQVRNAIPTLSDQELNDLATRATKAQSDFSAGYIGPGLFTLIVLVVILIIIVAVVH